MSDDEQLDVIAVGAHPDDVEIGCGGTVAKLAEAGWRVGIVDLTDGEPTPVSTGPEMRMAEAAAAATVLGVKKRITLPLVNRRLMDGWDERVALANVFRRHRPRLVIGLGERTPLASPDHWQAMQITDAAMFYSRLTKWDEKFEGTTPHRIKALLHYSLGYEPFTAAPAGTVMMVDIGSTLEKKIEAVKCYASQFPPEKAQLFDRVKAMNQSYGFAAGVEACERLCSPRPFAVTDLMGQLGLGRPL
ncbi:1D-myo-inositol 2-acetamido-2-deoxy-alpha-D-glucopyranoside deacetylase [Pseudobythopirellula maris]|uniref:1D-myo-inositol 2-acetamido-2-deoxy-alpha-D-glucopyranoside deacetylase n=1 Tax=Pseudobythopirellula maris TaxID=2527991 RepID=A0A5C5ZT20_9BACT|nr:PIG-L family deacetylase [Pseudobythopirellula maris]TWT90649.1 1D-myo-inositol 2-acetamido-2-deoxy-alpha-D-glucopyranoside deacetylase [Pseudobythopirellula maris]